MTALLEVRGLTKRFGGVVAIDGLDLVVAPNEILGLPYRRGVFGVELPHSCCAPEVSAVGEVPHYAA